MVQGHSGSTPIEAVTAGVAFALLALPREFNYIQKVENDSKHNVDLCILRRDFACKLATMAVASQHCELVRICFSKFDKVLDEYQFPKYNIDVDSFANDLLCAETGKRIAEKERVLEETRQRDKEVADLKKQAGRTDVQADTDMCQMVQIEDMEHMAGESVEDQRSAMSTTDGGCAPTFEARIVASTDKVPLHFGPDPVPRQYNHQLVFDTLVSAAMEAWAYADALKGKLFDKLEEHPDGVYVAKVYWAAGEVSMPYGGKRCARTSSRFRVRCDLGWVDGTSRVRTFPNPWKGIEYLEDTSFKAGNMKVVYADLPFDKLMGYAGSETIRLGGLKMPVARNHIEIKAGEKLCTTDVVVAGSPLKRFLQKKDDDGEAPEAADDDKDKKDARMPRNANLEASCIVVA